MFSQGDDAADAVFYIQSGKVRLTVVSKRGKEAVIAILQQGDFFGEGCLAGQSLRMATATATQRATIIRVARKTMMDLLHQDPELAERFVAHLLSRNIRMEEDLVDQLFNSSEKRLARLLLLLANFGQESKPVPVIAKMSQETLAEMIGTTRSRVSCGYNLGKLARERGAGSPTDSARFCWRANFFRWPQVPLCRHSPDRHDLGTRPY